MFYKVYYQSMTAFYGPKIVEAESEREAKKIFGGNAVMPGEFGCIKAQPVSDREVLRKLNA